MLTNFYIFLTGRTGDMVERGLILAAIVVAAVAIWFSIGQGLADQLDTVEGLL